MKQVDLEPDEYRRKRTIIYRVTHASKGQLWIATGLGIWAGAVWFHRFAFEFTPHPLITAAIAFVPGLGWYLWMAFTDP